MAKVIALAQTVRQHQPQWSLEALRTLIVCGCALALIAAHPLSFFG